MDTSTGEILTDPNGVAVQRQVSTITAQVRSHKAHVATDLFGNPQWMTAGGVPVPDSAVDVQVENEKLSAPLDHRVVISPGTVGLRVIEVDVDGTADGGADQCGSEAAGMTKRQVSAFVRRQLEVEDGG